MVIRPVLGVGAWQGKAGNTKPNRLTINPRDYGSRDYIAL